MSTFQVYNFCSLLVLTTGKSSLEPCADLDDLKTNNIAKQPTIYNNAANGLSEECCSSNGICSHEVLRDGKPDSDSKMVKKVCYKFLVKAKYAIMIILLQQGSLLMYMCVSTHM